MTFFLGGGLLLRILAIEMEVSDVLSSQNVRGVFPVTPA